MGNHERYIGTGYTVTLMNGQNFPRKGTSPIKLSFVPRFDRILVVDLSQAEWRGVAHLCQDPVMIKEIWDGVDPHRENAINFFGADPDGDPDKFDELRTTAKIMTFRLIYGGSAYSFYMDNKMPNYPLNEWQRIVEAFYKKYAVLKKWQDENIRKVWRNGGILRSITGRKFVFFKNEKNEYRPQQIKNWPVQSFATADIMPLAMNMIYREFKRRGFKSLPIGQVHDSLIFDVKESEMEEIARMCIDIFESVPRAMKKLWDIDLSVPITGDAEEGVNYGETHKLELAA